MRRSFVFWFCAVIFSLRAIAYTTILKSASFHVEQGLIRTVVRFVLAFKVCQVSASSRTLKSYCPQACEKCVCTKSSPPECRCKDVKPYCPIPICGPPCWGGCTVRAVPMGDEDGDENHLGVQKSSCGGK